MFLLRGFLVLDKLMEGATSNVRSHTIFPVFQQLLKPLWWFFSKHCVYSYSETQPTEPTLYVNGLQTLALAQALSASNEK